VNSILATRFSAQRQVLAHRFKQDPTLFKRQDWKKLDEVQRRTFVRDTFDKYVSSFEWNAKEGDIPVIPVAMGSSMTNAVHLVKNGFTPELSVSTGDFGTGMYVSTSAVYALAASASFKDPAIVLCFANTGNVFPAIEAADHKTSLKGRPLKPGYQSHFAVTKIDGKVAVEGDTPTFSDLVIGQETQLIPFCIIEIDKTVTAPVFSKYQR